MRTHFLFLLLILAYPSLFAQNSTHDIEIKAYGLVDPNTTLGKVVPFDIDQDGFEDLVYQQIYNDGSGGERSIQVNYVKGNADGLDLDNKHQILDDPDIITFFLEDWDGDGNHDLITRKIRMLPELGPYVATTDKIQIWYLNKTDTLRSINFQVPYQIYLGEETNPKELREFADMDLDGRKDMILIGFSHITIGWNNGTDIPEFDEITNYGYNTYNSKILDYNQDGWPDFVNDDQYWKKPVIHKNVQHRGFARIDVNLPSWDIQNEPSLYWDFERLWLDADPYPDILARKSSEGLEGANYKLFRLNPDRQKYEEMTLQIMDNDLGDLIPLHFNNDGFTDLAEIRSNAFRIWVNAQNTHFIPTEIELNTSWQLENVFHFDVDHDNDTDLFFSFFDRDTLYQIINNDTTKNSLPEPPELDTLIISNSNAEFSWKVVKDNEALDGHIGYTLNISSETSEFSAETHTQSFSANNLPDGVYQYSLHSTDPIGGVSKTKTTGTFTIITTSNELLKDIPNQLILHQNYPNPFNPSTAISYELSVNSYVSLKVYDLLGREIAELVNTQQVAGMHEVTFDASALSSGVYLYRMEANGAVQTKRFTLIK